MLSVAPSARHRGVVCSVDRMSGAHRLYAAMGFVRAPELDWNPVPQVRLVGSRRPL